jgi:uroporphyrinogen decarboxylase
MSLSSYEVVRRAIEFQKPDRLPVQFEELGISDVFKVPWNQIGVGDMRLKETTDEWGCGWTRTDIKNMGQVTKHPLSDWKALDRFNNWPDPNNTSFYEGMNDRFVGSDGKYVITVLFMLLFERMHALRGFENTLVDLYLERERIEFLANKIVEYDIEVINNIAKRYPGQIHGIIFSDDWGTQQNLIINTTLWREFFKPRYEKILQAVHKAGWHAWMHTCGYVTPIIGDLIDIELDAINLQQPTLLGIQEVGKLFRGKICFVSLCDIQHTLPFKDEQAIKDEAQLLLHHWATPEGGFILSDYGDGDAIGVERHKKESMLKAFLDGDPWKPR